MKNFILLTGLVMIFMTNAYSQTGDQTITLQKKKYYQNGQKLTSKEMKTILAGNPASAEEYHMYKKNMNVVAPLAITGTACILVGTVLNLASTVKDANNADTGEMTESSPSGLGLILIGCAAALVTIPFAIPATKHFKNAINNYNTSLQKTGCRPVQLKMLVGSNRVGLRVNF